MSKVRINSNAVDAAVGLEVRVNGWGSGPFFTVRAVDANTGKIGVSHRHSRKIKYWVSADQAYFTERCGRIYRERTASLCQQVEGGAK